MNRVNFTFKWQALRSSLMMTLCLFMISMVSVQNVNAQNQGDLIIATNAEIVIPSCIDEITYFYFFTTVDDDPNSPTVGTPTITGLDDYAFTGPTQIDLHDAGGFNYATWEIAITIDGGNNTDFFTITYESETVTPAIDVIKDTDIDVAVLAPDQNVTIPVCEDNMDILASFTVLDCAGAPALETDFQLQGFGQFAGQALSTSLSDVASGPNQRTYFITNPGGAFASLNVVESASPSSDRITITYKGTSAELRVNAVAQFEEPDAVIGDNMDITAVDCSDNVTFFYAFNIIGFCGEFDGRLTVFDDGGTGIGTFPPFVNITGNTAYVEYQGQVPNFKDGVARNYFPDFEFDGNLLDSDLFPTITVRSSLNEAPTLQLPDNLTFRIPVCEDEIEEKVSVQICDDCDVNGGVLRWTFGNQDALELDLASIQVVGNCLYAEMDITLTEADNGTTLSLEAIDPEGAFSILTANIEVIKEDVPDFSQLSCNPNAHITISGSDDCTATIIPSMLLNANSLCPDVEAQIHIAATLKEAHHVANPTQEDVEGMGSITVHTPGKYKYTITMGDDECWGYFIVEDKDAPICAPAGDKEPDTYICGSTVKYPDPSGVDDLATEYVSIVVIDKYGKDALEPWFDVLEADDFLDCSDMANIEYTTTKESFCGGEYEMNDEDAKKVPQGWEICMIFTRTWTAYDWKGNEVEEPCSQQVKVLRPTRKSVHVKEKVTGECGHDDVNAYYPYFEDLGPGKDGLLQTCPQTSEEKIVLKPGVTIGKWNANVELGPEIEICNDLGEDCSNSFKQINEWTLVDVCSYETYEIEQVYRFEDTKGPAITINAVDVWTNPFDCTTSMTASFSATDKCSSVVGGSITAEYEIEDEHGNVIKTVRETIDGFSITLENVPLEVEVNFEYSAWDCCGNMSTDDNSANSWDDRAPVCVANDLLEVGLIPTDHDGHHSVGARIYPEDLDDTSKDNCFPLKMEIRKVYANGSLGDWGPYVEYSYDSDDDFNGDKCTDVQWVDLRVTEIRKDGSLGLSTVCQSKLILRDNNAPKFISVGQDYSQNCFAHDYKFDAPEVWGFCLTPGEKDSSKEYHCPTTVDGYENVIKTHTKTWTYTKMTEHDMKTISTSQTIYVTSVRDEVFTLPYDVKLKCSTDIPGPASLDDILVNDGCSEWVMNVEEEKYLGDDEACYKIIRTYDFINWCLFDEEDLDDHDIVDKDPADHNGDGKLLEADGDYQVVLETGDDEVEDGRFRYVQIIKVIDDTKPTLTFDVKVTCDIDNDCDLPGDVKVNLTPADVCSEGSVTEYLLEPFNGGDLITDPFGSLANNMISGAYPTGSHTFHVRVDDQCGNFSWTSIPFEVGVECKKPTPVALAAFTALMENCMVDIWISDIQSGSSYDNCTAYEDLKFGIELVGQDGLVSDVMPTAQSVTITAAGTGFVALWVMDEAGNTQYTLVPITAVDNDGCAGSDPVVAGKIVNENDEDIDDVMVSAKGNDMSTISQIFNGTFNFSAIPMHTNVSISAEKNIGHLNGVSTADLVLMQRHVLGIAPLTSAYKIIAADANNDTAIDTRDMLHVSRLILGIYDELPNNNSWRFVAKDHNFANPTQPWGFPEAIDFADLSADAQADFIGIKIGDLSGNALPSNLLGSDDTKVGKMNIAIDDATIAAGETKTIEFTTAEFNDFAGYQFTIALDSRVAFDGIKAGSLEGVTDANFGLSAIENGIITTNWANVEGVSVENGTVMFSLTVTASQDVKVSDILNVNSAVTTAEAYNNNLDVFDVAVKFNRANAGFELFQNTPNPVSGETIIGFNLPEAGTATLKVMDVAGRTIKAVSGDYAKGYNTIILDKADLNATGVLYYQLDTNNNSATKKMVILD